MNYLLRILVCALAVLMISFSAEAQKGKKSKKTVKNPPANFGVKTPTMAPAETPKPKYERVDVKLDSAGYNALSLRPVHKSDILYKNSVWRKLDLREKCNQPFLATGSEITKFIINGVLEGKIRPFLTDSVNMVMSKEEFMERIKEPSSGDAAPMIDPITGKPIAQESASSSASYFMPKQLYILEMKEDWLFDKQRSQAFYDIQSITIILPAELNPIKGTETKVATFRYKELASYLRNLTDAKWYNVQNQSEHRSFPDAFDLRLFCSRIIKLANPSDNYIQDMSAYNKGGDKSILITSQKLEQDMIEKESQLWEY